MAREHGPWAGIEPRLPLDDQLGRQRVAAAGVEDLHEVAPPGRRHRVPVLSRHNDKKIINFSILVRSQKDPVEVNLRDTGTRAKATAHQMDGAIPQEGGLLRGGSELDDPAQAGRRCLGLGGGSGLAEGLCHQLGGQAGQTEQEGWGDGLE